MAVSSWGRDQLEETIVVSKRVHAALDAMADIITDDVLLTCETPRTHEGVLDTCGECTSCAIARLLLLAGYIEELSEVVCVPLT